MEVKVLQNVLKVNDSLAARNRELFNSKKVFAIDMMSSPGAGKTTLLEETAKKLAGKIRFGVIEGDLATAADAERIARQDVPVLQINTGKGCHLDANQIQSALEHFNLDQLEVLFIENVGNLVCPAEFDLGQHTKVLLLSTPEGDDKPEKYPVMFRQCSTILINKVDLLPYVPFDMAKVKKQIKDIHPQAHVIEISCRTGDGLEQWVDWIENQLEEFSKQK
jgi:hydrogenase nickel incorporation protein HypB